MAYQLIVILKRWVWQWLLNVSVVAKVKKLLTICFSRGDGLRNLGELGWCFWLQEAAVDT